MSLLNVILTEESTCVPTCVFSLLTCIQFTHMHSKWWFNFRKPRNKEITKLLCHNDKSNILKSYYIFLI